MNWKRANRILQMAFLLLVAIFIIYVCVNFGSGMLEVLKEGDVEALESYVGSAGKGGVLIIVALQVLQTITVIFPGIPIYMAAGVIFGRWKGMLICYITYVVINSAVFLFARRLGNTANVIMSGKNENEEHVSGLMQRSKHPCILIGALCMIPVVPNGLVPHLASQANIRFYQFVESVAVGCIPCILLFVGFGDLLMSKYFVYVVVILAAVLVITVLGYIFRAKLGVLLNRFLEKHFGGGTKDQSK